MASISPFILTPRHAGACDSSELLIGRTIRVCWSRTVNGLHDPFQVCAASEHTLHHARVSLEVIVTFVDATHVEFEAWLVLPSQRRSMLRCAAPYMLLLSDDMMHADITPDAAHNGEFLLRLTLQASHVSLLFAATPLLAQAGFSGGSYDRPTAQFIDLAELSC